MLSTWQPALLYFDMESLTVLKMFVRYLWLERLSNVRPEADIKYMQLISILLSFKTYYYR